MRGGPTDGLHDVLVAGAAADIAADALADYCFVGLRVAVEQPPRRHDHARCAEPTLQAVLFHESLLNGIECAVLLEILDGAHGAPRGHHCERRATLHGLPIDPKHTRSAI